MTCERRYASPPVGTLSKKLPAWIVTRSGRPRALLSAWASRTTCGRSYLYVNDRLAKFYGVNTNATDDFLKVTFSPKERSGVVTHPYLLSEFWYQKSTSPIHRGVFLTRN